MSESVSPAVGKFFHSIIDYAGLFPPASLNLRDAFTNFLNYRQGYFSWLLSKFICPAGKVMDLSGLVNADLIEDPVKLSLLAGQSKDPDEFIKKFSEDIAVYRNLPESFQNCVRTESIEIRLPDELAVSNDKNRISVFLDTLTDLIKENFAHRVFLFCEVPRLDNFDSHLKHTVQGIELHNEKHVDAGFKLRTGGTEASDFPEPAIILHAIRQCLNHKVPLKFTAGMHHPFRHYDSGTAAKMHGFVNVFGAGVLAFRHAVSDHELKQMISDEDPDNFGFIDGQFRWKDWVCTPEEIHGARNSLVISFGSCSFDEPVEDLIELKYISSTSN
ncbi:MAG: hypothetical protein K1X85_08330 [Ignavibacteria bacterium]|nr:hypothetical protein [Ignavibacteria bacterium]